MDHNPPLKGDYVDYCKNTISSEKFLQFLRHTQNIPDEFEARELTNHLYNENTEISLAEVTISIIKGPT